MKHVGETGVDVICIQLAHQKFQLTKSGFNRREKLYCPCRQRRLAEKALKLGNFEMALAFH